MDIDYLIYLWKRSNCDYILIKSLPLARLTDRVVVEPTITLSKNEKVVFGKELTSYEYLKELFENSIFEYINSDEELVVKEIYRKC